MQVNSSEIGYNGHMNGLKKNIFLTGSSSEEDWRERVGIELYGIDSFLKYIY